MHDVWLQGQKEAVLQGALSAAAAPETCSTTNQTRVGHLVMNFFLMNDNLAPAKPDCDVPAYLASERVMSEAITTLKRSNALM